MARIAKAGASFVPRRDIEYYLPPLGMVRGTLFAESAEAYLLLEDMRELDRLQTLPQLGAIRLAWAGARHSRWEFVVLCLDLLRRAVDLPRVPMTSRVALHGGTRVSSYRELLQTWLLLLGVGHLEWTFTAEQSLLRAVVKEANRGKRGPHDELIESVPTSAGRDWAAKVLAEERSYQFYQLISFFRLARAPVKRLSKDALEKQLMLLESYCVSRRVEPLAVTRARDLFRRVRRLAFLSLDAEFTPSILGVNIARIINDQPTLERLLAPQAPSGGEDELRGLHRNLATRVYSGEEVLLQIARRRMSLDAKVLDALRKGGLRYVIGELASGGLQRGLRSETSLSVAARLVLDRRLVRLPVGTTVPARALELRTQEESAADWARHCQTRLVLMAVRDASDEQYIVQMHSLQNAQSAAAALVFCHYWVQNFAPPSGIAVDSVGVYLIQRWVLGPFAEQLILAGLKTAFGSRFRWEWDGSVGDVRAFAVRRHAFKETFQLLTGTADLSDARRAELQAVLTCAAFLRTELLVGTLANLKAYADDDLRPCAELDGVAIGVSRRRHELVIQLIEAKNLRRRSTATARAALKQKMSVLAATDDRYVHVGSVRTPVDARSGRAWVYVRIPFRPT
jgi:hypothetical protein